MGAQLLKVPETLSQPQLLTFAVAVITSCLITIFPDKITDAQATTKPNIGTGISISERNQPELLFCSEYGTMLWVMQTQTFWPWSDSSSEWVMCFKKHKQLFLPSTATFVKEQELHRQVATSFSCLHIFHPNRGDALEHREHIAHGFAHSASFLLPLQQLWVSRTVLAPSSCSK